MAKRKSAKTPARKLDDSKYLQAVYAKSRREFSAADLQKFTEVEEGIPLEKLIAAMERIQYPGKSRKR